MNLRAVAFVLDRFTSAPILALIMEYRTHAANARKQRDLKGMLSEYILGEYCSKGCFNFFFMEYFIS